MDDEDDKDDDKDDESDEEDSVEKLKESGVNLVPPSVDSTGDGTKREPNTVRGSQNLRIESKKQTKGTQKRNGKPISPAKANHNTR